MELYINWIAGAGNTHDVFYTNPKIIASYRKQSRRTRSKDVLASCSRDFCRVIRSYNCRAVQKLPEYLCVGIDERGAVLWRLTLWTFMYSGQWSGNFAKVVWCTV